MKHVPKSIGSIMDTRLPIEFGSFYHDPEVKLNKICWSEPEKVTFTGSGRDALYTIVNALKTLIIAFPEDKGGRLWLPSYYCHPITEVLARCSDVRIYNSTPFVGAQIDQLLSEKDIVVAPEYFGNKSELLVRGNPIILLDKTHNPLSHYDYEFDIAFEFGSLRKILPTADGGFIRASDKFKDLIRSTSTTEYHKSVVALVRSAMKKKSHFLTLGQGKKSEYLKLYAKGESSFGDVLNPSGSTYPHETLLRADFNYYFQKRIRNKLEILERLESFREYLTILESPLFLILQFESNPKREMVRQQLIKESIYSAVLWPVDDRYMNSSDIELSESMLVVPTDHRYNKEQVELLSFRLEKVLKEVYAVN